MQPTTQIQASDGTQLDPSVVALAKSIRSAESKNDYNAQGKSGERGAYQWMPGNFEKDAQRFGLDPNDFSPINQDKVAYHALLEDKKAGLTPEQATSKWNSGDPNAYLQNHTGTNSQGVSYDTPTYVKNVIGQYNGYKQQYLQQNPQPNQPTQPTQPESLSQPHHQDWMKKTADILGGIFGGNKIGELIGGLYDKATGVPGINEKGQTVDYSSNVELPTAGQVAGDVGKSALTIASAPLLGASGLGLAGRLGLNTAIGAGLGATNALANKQNVGTQTAVGAGLGLAGGVVGEVAGKLLNVLPKWLVASGLKGADEGTLDSAMNGKFITLNQGLNESKGAISDTANSLETISKSAEEANNYLGKIGATVKNFVSDPEIQADIPSAIKGIQDDIVPNFAQRGIDPEITEQIKLLNPAKYTSVDDFLNDASQLIKTFSKEKSTPLFEEIAKNHSLHQVLLNTAKAANVPTKIGLRDLLAIVLGHAGGIPGSIALEGLNRFAESPGAEIATGKVAQGLGGLIRGAGQTVRTPLTSGLISATNQ